MALFDEVTEWMYRVIPQSALTTLEGEAYICGSGYWQADTNAWVTSVTNNTTDTMHISQITTLNGSDTDTSVVAILNPTDEPTANEGFNDNAHTAFQGSAPNVVVNYEDMSQPSGGTEMFELDAPSGYARRDVDVSIGPGDTVVVSSEALGGLLTPSTLEAAVSLEYSMVTQ